MIEPEDGEILLINWGLGFDTPPYEVLRGHIPVENACHIISLSFELVPFDAYLWRIEHGYARWTPDRGTSVMMFNEAKRGHGAFPVTYVYCYLKEKPGVKIKRNYANWRTHRSSRDLRAHARGRRQKP